MSSVGLGTKLRKLIDMLDRDVEAAYCASDLDYRPRFTPVVRALDEGGPQTIKSLAATALVSHSALSQTISQMLARRLIVVESGADARERLISLSEAGLALVPLLRRHWDATHAAVEDLEADVGVSLTRVVDEALAALERKPFLARMPPLQ
ncbi:MAG: MarR family transcriptional regulator [Alphaproteobacteria bacterium]|nr:MAG: MarR family transcriptional regulator [Alphaproteobacteria bacterium]